MSLMRLSMREAARTSVLSKTWRQRWADVSQVVFDATFPCILSGTQRSTSHHCVMKTVYEVLLLHSGPLHKFELSITGLKSCPEIDRLIRFLSKKDIQDFNLQISSGGHGRHKLPSYFFSCSELRFLKLVSCMLNPPLSFKGFSQLISLEFWKVRFDAESFKNFISNCPLLEHLILSHCSEISCLELNAPSLKSLRYNGIYKSFCFKNTPLLAEVFLYAWSDREPWGPKISNLIEFFGWLPAVETLAVDGYFLKNVAVPDASMRPQAALNDLMLFDLCFSDMEEVSCALCLLRISPSLRELLITVSYNAGTNSVLQHLESESKMDFSLNELQVVQIVGFAGTRAEVELVKLLLTKSSSLKRMHIKFSVHMVDNEKVKILEDIARFKRASLEAEIVCL